MSSSVLCDLDILTSPSLGWVNLFYGLPWGALNILALDLIFASCSHWQTLASWSCRSFRTWRSRGSWRLWRSPVTQLSCLQGSPGSLGPGPGRQDGHRGGRGWLGGSSPQLRIFWLLNSPLLFNSICALLN